MTKKHTLTLLTALLLAPLAALPAKEDLPSGASSDKARVDQILTETHKASLRLRGEALRKTVAKDTCLPSGVWGDNLWCLAALYLNERTDLANARLLKRAQYYIATKPANAPMTKPEQPK